MPITTVRCDVLGANVRRITDLEGTVIRVICPEYQEPAGICRLRSDASKGGPLSRLLERVDEDTLASHGVLCAVR
jgi:hypothetical protein